MFTVCALNLNDHAGGDTEAQCATFEEATTHLHEVVMNEIGDPDGSSFAQFRCPNHRMPASSCCGFDQCSSSSGCSARKRVSVSPVHREPEPDIVVSINAWRRSLTKRYSRPFSIRNSGGSLNRGTLRIMRSSRVSETESAARYTADRCPIGNIVSAQYPMTTKITMSVTRRPLTQKL